eukprot:Gb_27873 [translate_table: standard]
MWALRKTANHLRAHGKYGNVLRVSASKLDNWDANVIPSCDVGKITAADETDLYQRNVYIFARDISYSKYQKFVPVSRGFSSQVGAEDKDEENQVEEGFSELESPRTSNNGGEADELLVSEDEFSELESPDNSHELAHADPYLSEAEADKDRPKEDSQAAEISTNATPLYRVALDCKYQALRSSLDQWLADGNVLSREEVVSAFIQLRRRRMFRRALQVSDWLEDKKPFELSERDHAARLDLIAKVQGILKAQKYLESIPSELRGQKVYRTLLANCSSANNIKKAEEVFNKMKDAGCPLTAFECNQLLLLYKRQDRKKIAVILQLMENEDIKPTAFTYRILIDAKGRAGNIDGMEQVLENMKAEDIQPESGTLAVLAQHYIAAGLIEKAEAVLKDVEKEGTKDKRSVMKMLLPLYADLGKVGEVERVWKVCESFSNLLLNEYVAAIVAWGKLGQIEKAEAIFESMLNSGKKVSAKHYNALLGVYADHKLLLKGKELVKRMSDNGCVIEATTLDALVKLYVKSGELEKADSILFKACNQKQIRPLYRSLMTILEKYAERGDVANAEKIFDRLRQAGYTGRMGPYEQLLQTYAKAHVPAYGFKERMMADKIFPNKRLSSLLNQVDSYKKDPLSDLLE